MFIPPSLLQATNLIKDGSIEIQIGRNSVRLERDLIQINVNDIDSLQKLLDRDDILPQMKYISEEFSKAGKTLEINYRNSRVIKLGAHADSVVLRLLGIPHMAVGNPVTVYRFLRVWGKS